MGPTGESPYRLLNIVAVCLLAGVAFACACGQAPLYYSNQNQYFLHGLARAEKGLLHEDWLANTLDPTPLFSGLVEFTARSLHPWMFHVYYGLLMAVHVIALLGLFVALVGWRAAARHWPVYVVLIVLAHSALIRWASYRLLGQDYPYFLQTGVAGQYILGAMFQPSAFGVLLVAAIALFALDRPLGAAVCVAAGATLHATYLLPGALLTLGFVTALFVRKRPRMALGVGGLALVLVAPIVVFVFRTFTPTSPDLHAQAQDILANFRIPHHTRVDLWLDPVSMLQIAWIVLGIALTWGTRLFAALAVPFVLSALLTLAQVLTKSDTLALLFPWRISAVLMPVATAIILSRLFQVWKAKEEGEVQTPSVFVLGPACFVLGCLAASGLWISGGRHGYHVADEELGVMNHVREHKKTGDVYLLPVRIHLSTGKRNWQLSSDFRPLPEKRSGAHALSPDLQRFRLYTEAPIFVDFKAIPYRDTDVIEWQRRLFLARDVQEYIRKGEIADALALLKDTGVTHLILPAAQELTGFQPEYQDEHYRVYRLASQPSR